MKGAGGARPSTKGIVGTGKTTKMFTARHRKDATIQIAIKVVNKEILEPERLEQLYKEIAIMQKVDHPNVVKYLETYDDQKYLYLCSELCEGGSVNKQKLPMTEAQVAKIAQEILRALQHCHQQDITHKAIKP